MSDFHNIYSTITSLENLFQAWNEFKKGKRKKRDVQHFERNLEDNIFSLYEKLKEKTYKHGSYVAFDIYDPKFRHIHKASVPDRIIHNAVISVLEPIFDKSFIFDSYSCRKSKGTHRAVKRLFSFIRKTSKNYTESCFCLKMDIKKFFENIDHNILVNLIERKIEDKNCLRLIGTILKSFSEDKGVPIGNLTSQLFANIYLNELDQFVKHKLRIKYYIRYADDFVIMSRNYDFLKELIIKIDKFVKEKLSLSLHENKIIIRKYSQGIDFLGYILLPHYILPRTKTKRRILKKIEIKIEKLNSGKISGNSFDQTIQSYFGYLNHTNTYILCQKIKNKINLV